MTEFCFIHAADLHLGCAFQGIRQEEPAVARVLAEATYTAFDRIVTLAEREDAAFVVFSGDVYNAQDGNLRAQLRFRDGLRRLDAAGIPSFVACGNHDPLPAGGQILDWPASSVLFPAEPAEPLPVTRNGETLALVSGISYGNRAVQENLARQYRQPPAGPFSVAVLHANCGNNAEYAPYAPCSLTDLRALNYDYWALGHIHRHAILQERDPLVVYPGSPQGLDPTESGAHGCCLVRVTADGQVTVTFRETDAVRWQLETVGIEEFTRPEDLIAFLEARRDALRDENGERAALVRFRLVGRGPLHRWLREPGNLEAIQEQLRAGENAGGFVWTESLQVETRPEAALDALRQGQDFLGDFLRLAEETAQSETALAELRTELDALFRVGGMRRMFPDGAPDEARLRRLLEEAAALGADLLLRQEGE